MKPILLLLITLTFTTSVQAQIERNNIWYFGYNAGLDFTSGTPTALTDGALWSHEGCSSISDNNGSLLFYTNGGNFSFQDTGAIWNKNHQIMPNGLLYGGCHSSTQSVSIIPMPNDPMKYYVFTLDCVENWLKNGLMYSVVDMTLDGGLGDITTKEVELKDTVNEGIVAIPHSNGIDFWITVHIAISDSFYVYPVTASGILPPLKQKVGPLRSAYCGPIKASPKGDKIALFSCPNESSGIFHFDPSSGIISNFQALDGGSPYGTFSPNGEVLYALAGDNLYQYNLAAANILASKLLIASGIQSSSMQIAPDGKVYIASPGNTHLHAINCPNIVGLACDFESAAVSLDGRECSFGLPNHVDSYFLDVTDPCSVTTTSLFEPSIINYQIAPNPFNHSATLTFENSTNETHTLILYDTEGRIVRTMRDVTSNQIIIEKANLPIGLYFFQLFTDSRQATSGKLVIE